MERKLAVVKNGIVENVIIVDPLDTATIAHFGGNLLPEDSACGIGWTHDGVTFAPPVLPVTELTVTDITQAVQRHLDNTAKIRNYDGILSCASYSASTNPTFAAEATAAIAWRDAVWAYCYTQLALVQDGQRALPPDTFSLIAELPELVW